MSENTRKAAIKRLQSDLKELKLNPLPNISAEPLSSNLFEWHCNILAPDDTCYHVILYIPDNYPFKAPSAEFAPNGFKFPDTYFSKGKKGSRVCLSIFSDFAKSHPKWDTVTNHGWSAAYTIQTILISTIAMFKPDRQSSILSANKALVMRYSCKDCGHSTDNPHPPFNTDVPEATSHDNEQSLCTGGTHNRTELGVSVVDNSSCPIGSSAGEVPMESDGNSSQDEYVIATQELANVSKQEPSSSSDSQSVISLSASTLAIHDYISKEQISITKTMNTDMIFGFGVSQTSSSRHKLLLTTPCEYMSRQSFYTMEELRGSAESVMRVKLQAFLPLYIHHHQGAIIQEDFIKCINKLGVVDKDTVWRPAHRNDGIIRTMCLLMMSTIAKFSYGGSHVSEAKVRGLFELHRLFIWATDTYPNLREDIDKGIDEFIQHEEKRHIQNIPQLAEWLMTLIMSSKCRLAEVLPLYLEEHCRRDVYQLVSSSRRLGDKSGSKRYRIRKTLKLTKKARKQLVMQVFMIRLLRSKSFSGVKADMLQKIKDGAEKIVPKASKSYDELYEFLDFSPTASSFEVLVEALDFAVKTPGYHPGIKDCKGGWKELLYPNLGPDAEPDNPDPSALCYFFRRPKMCLIQ